MRILVVTQYFWPENFRINEIARGLAERGHEVTVYTGKPNYPQGSFHEGYGFFGRSREDYGGVTVVRVPLLPRGSHRVTLALNYLSFALFACALAPFRVRGAFDAILCYEPSPVTVGLPALALRRLKHAPLLFWVQDLWPESLAATGAVRARWVLRGVEWVVRFIYRGCDRLLVQSRAFVEPLEALGVPGERISYFPNSAESFYRPTAAEEALGEGALLVPAGFRLMYAGNVGAAQDFETILAAAEHLKEHTDIQWIVIGDGRAAPWVRAEVARRGLERSVRLLGRHPAESMPRFFAHADAMLVTLRREPIFALTIPARIQSYLACARPIVAALDGEGARVVRESGAGIAVAAGDPRALADAVLAMARAPAEARADMGRWARAYFDAHFAPERLLPRLERWLEAARREWDAGRPP
ncbi:MAG: glycosyltransferase family 4 protein [Burkholderiales bacterium]|nr:glycosyltransferase family 4 protein [Burkholderiales bacterium]